MCDNCYHVVAVNTVISVILHDKHLLVAKVDRVNILR